MAWIEWYKWLENTQSVEKTDFSSTLNNKVKKSIDFKSIKNKEKLSRDIENALEKSSIKSLDERWKVADFLLDNFKSKNIIKDKIKLIIENEAETLENVKELLEVETEKKEVEKKVSQNENEYEKYLKLVEEKEKIEEKTSDEKEKTSDEKENFFKYKEKVDRVHNSLVWLNENHPVYWNIIREFWNLTDRIISENLSLDEIKKETLKILAEFKQNPEKLQAVVKDLGWVGSAKYEEFRESIIAVDSDFASILPDIEAVETWEKLSTKEIVDWVEKENWGVVDIELWENPPMYKMRVIWSEYWFENEIDKWKLAEITNDNKEELNGIYDNWFKILKDFKSNFSKQNYDISKMDDLYSYFDIDSNLQINPSDLQDFRNAETQEEKIKIFAERIKPKIEAINKIVKQKQQEVLWVHKEQIKQLLEKQIKTKEKQKETLDFLHKIGFDLIPQNITNELIAEIKSNVIQVKWLNINPKSLDLKKWIFWNSWLEANSEQVFKENIIKFLNKLIYWEINPQNSPLNPNDFIWVMWASINPTEMLYILSRGYFFDKNLKNYYNIQVF